MINVFFGIDPGKSGSISAIWVDGEPFVNSCKLNQTEADISTWLYSFDITGYDSGRSIAVLEKVHAMPKQGVTSSFSFGQSYGFLRGVLTALQIPFVEVSPQRWQKAMGCLTKGNKNVTKQAAQQRWPHLKITHANADSLLIAEYARTVLHKGK